MCYVYMTDLMRHSVSDHYPRSDLLSHTSSLPIQPQLQHGPKSSPLCYLFTRETIWDSFIYFEGAWCQCHLHIIQLHTHLYIFCQTGWDQHEGEGPLCHVQTVQQQGSALPYLTQSKVAMI